VGRGIIEMLRCLVTTIEVNAAPAQRQQTASVNSNAARRSTGR
jgi:hypothetical protein